MTPAKRIAELVKWATQLRRIGRISDSIAPLKEAILLDPNNPVIQHDLGLTYLHCERATEAIICFRRAVTLKPNFTHAYYRLGLAFEQINQDQEALQAYRRAVTQTPKLCDAHVRLGNLLLKQGRRREASKAFRKAAAAASNTTEKQLNLAKALVVEDKDKEAEVALRSLLAKDRNSSTAHTMLGTILVESGLFTEGAAAFYESITLNPHQGVAYYYLVRSRKITEHDRALVNGMAALSGKLRETDQQILLELALGKALDDLGDYASAIRHFEQANQIKKTVMTFDREAFVSRNERIIRRFTADFITSSRNSASESKLPVFIVGMPRTGTTLVEQIISSHRDVAGAGELRFWMQAGDGLDQSTEAHTIAEFQRKTADEYLALLRRQAPTAARVTDKMPFNFFWVGLIHIVFPNATIIHCHRDPIDTCLSIFSTYFAPRPDFPTDRDDLVFYYREYLRLMAHWQRVIPAERIVDVHYEELISAPEEVSRRLIAACRLDWDPSCLAPERNNRSVKTASKWQVRQPIYANAVGRWRRYEPWIGEFRDLLAEEIAGKR